MQWGLIQDFSTLDYGAAMALWGSCVWRFHPISRRLDTTFEYQSVRAVMDLYPTPNAIPSLRTVWPR